MMLRSVFGENTFQLVVGNLSQWCFSTQAHVFGAGYPSLPTMTVDDWYDQHSKHGVLPDQGLPRRVAAEDDTEQEEEAKEETANDDEETVQKARDWDDWKDSHRRGYGNRHNMG